MPPGPSHVDHPCDRTSRAWTIFTVSGAQLQSRRDPSVAGPDRIAGCRSTHSRLRLSPWRYAKLSGHADIAGEPEREGDLLDILPTDKSGGFLIAGGIHAASGFRVVDASSGRCA